MKGAGMDVGCLSSLQMNNSCGQAEAAEWLTVDTIFIESR